MYQYIESLYVEGHYALTHLVQFDVIVYAYVSILIVFTVVEYCFVYSCFRQLTYVVK